MTASNPSDKHAPDPIEWDELRNESPESSPTPVEQPVKPPKPYLLIITATCLFFVDNLLLVGTEFLKMLESAGENPSRAEATFHISATLTTIVLSLLLQAFVVALFVGVASIGRGKVTVKRFFAAASIAYALYFPLKLIGCAVQFLPAFAEQIKELEEQTPPDDGTEQPGSG